MPLITMLLAAGVTATPTIPQMQARMYRECSTKALEGAPPEMRHLIPQVCTCFVTRISADKTREQMQQALDRDQGALGRQCITEAAQADGAKRR